MSAADMSEAHWAIITRCEGVRLAAMASGQNYLSPEEIGYSDGGLDWAPGAAAAASLRERAPLDKGHYALDSYSRGYRIAWAECDAQYNDALARLTEARRDLARLGVR